MMQHRYDDTKKRFVDTYNDSYIHEWFIEYIFDNEQLLDMFIAAHNEKFEEFKWLERQRMMRQL